MVLLDKTPKAHEIKAKKRQMGLYQCKTFLDSEGSNQHNEEARQPTEWKKILQTIYLTKD
jgi:hypothetical protein